MRLIDADALEKYLRDYKWEFAMGSDFSKAMEMIDAQPIAYDVEKVVAELEKLNAGGIRMIEDGKYELIRKKEALEVVRKGGVE